MTAYVIVGDGHPTRYQPLHCRCHITWVLPGSPSVDAAAAAASAVPITMTMQRMKHNQVMDRIQSK